MKRFCMIMAAAMVCCAAIAQKEVTLKAGTIVLLQSVNMVKAADVHEGETVDFRVTQDVMADGVCVISQGTLVKGKVLEARKSTVGGTKGRLVINISNCVLPEGEIVYFTNTDARIYGRNRTTLAVIIGVLTGGPGLLIPGSKAVMPSGYEVQATVGANAKLVIKN